MNLCDTSSIVYFQGKLLYHIACEIRNLDENDITEPLLSDLKNIASILDIEVDKLSDNYYRFLDYPCSEKIKQIHKENCLLQLELGEMLGVTSRAVERLEHGKNKVSRETWEQLKVLKLL
jgi:transcriptional regulator with XRE-family HTH domain